MRRGEDLEQGARDAERGGEGEQGRVQLGTPAHRQFDGEDDPSESDHCGDVDPRSKGQPAKCWCAGSDHVRFSASAGTARALS